MNSLNLSFKKTITILTLLLILVNLFVISGYSLQERRLMRLFSVCSYFIVLWIYKGFKDKTILYIFILLLFADIFNLYYEYDLMNKLVSVAKITAYFLIAKSVFTKLRLFKNTKPLIILFFSIIVSLNLVLVYQVVWETSDKMNDNLEVVLFLLYGIVIIGMGLISIHYNFRYHTKRSMYFLYFVFALILSDISWFIAYFLEIRILFYADILFYLAALYATVKYAIETSKKDDVLLF